MSTGADPPGSSEHERFEARVLAASPNQIAVVDSDHRYVYVNPTYEQARGCVAGELVGRHVADVLGRQVYEEFVREKVERCLSGEEVVYEAWFDLPTGPQYKSVRYLPLRNAEGLVDSLVMLAVDLTEQKRAEQILRESEEQQRHYVECAPIPIFIMDRDWRFLDVNDAACAMTGYDREELACLSVRELVAPEWREVEAEAFERALAAGEVSVDFALARKNGERAWVTLKAVVAGDDRFIGFCDDKTEQRKVEEQLRQSQKMDAIGRLAGGIAHDFNNLLTVIRCNLSLLRSLVPEGRAIKLTDEIDAASHRAAELTKQLLIFSRQKPTSAEPLAVNLVIREIGSLLGKLLGENIELKLELSPDATVVVIDRGGFEQVLTNLFVNARDAMPQGGRLTVRTSAVATSGDGKPDEVVVEVADTGCGIPADLRAKIFEPFFTTKPPGQGTGLGLSIAYGIVAKAGGRIELDDAVGGGTRVRLRFPRSARAAPQRLVEDAHAKPIAKVARTILIVDDEPPILRIARLILEDSGYIVFEAQTGREAVDIVRREPIDLLLTDVAMPEMNGPATYDACRAVRPGLGVLFMSGYAEGEMLQRSGLTTRLDYLAKPFEPAELAAAVAEVLATLDDGAP